MRIGFLYCLITAMAINMLFAHEAYSQNPSEVKVTVQMENEKLDELFRKIEQQTKFFFAFSADQLKDIPAITFPSATRTVKETLELAFANTLLSYRQADYSLIIYTKPKEEPKQEPRTKIQGTVRDKNNTPLPGVTILIKGTNTGVTTDAEGHFSIDANPEDILLFSFIGYKKIEEAVGNRSTIDITLEEDISTLEEVVVSTNYYEMKQRESTANISKIGADIISKQPAITNPIAALQGRAPGVFIQETTGVPGGDVNIQIRGRNSLRIDGNQPLYVVDGVPFSAEKVSSPDNTTSILSPYPGTIQSGGASPLTSINPADIESIEILKDADATAIYGSRGANGVVLITTKKGKPGKTKIDVNYFTGFGRARLPELLNTQQYLAIRREAFVNDGYVPSDNPDDDGRDPESNLRYAPDLTLWSQSRYTDWQQVLIGGTARTNSIQTSISGGNENTQFLASTGFFKQTTVFPGDFYFRKLSSHIALNHQSVDRRFRFNASVSGTIDKNFQPQHDLSGAARELSPNAPALHDENGELNWEPHPDTGIGTWRNPLAGLNGTYEANTNNLITNVMLGYELVKGLKLQSRFGTNRLESDEFTLQPSTIYDPALGYNSHSSVVIKSHGKTSSWIIEPQLSYDVKISKGVLSTLVGATFQDQEHSLVSDLYSDFLSNSMLHNVSSAVNHLPWGYTSSIYRYAAAYGRVNFNWDGKYIINLTGRRDGSSRFGSGRQFSNFGAVGAAWLFAEEKVVKTSLPWLSTGKLRGSYGITGNDQIGNYQYLDTYVVSAGGADNQYNHVTGLDPERLYNKEFGWESNKKLEAALELGFWQDRLMVGVSIYQNRSSNQLVTYTLPKTTGFGGILANLPATVQNTGIEILLSSENIKNDRLAWTTSFNATIPRNKLLEFPGLDSSSYANTYIIGKSIYIQKFFDHTGVNPETGYYSFRDYNNDGIIRSGDDMQKAMFVGQTMFGGINNTVTWNGFTIDVFFQFVRQTGYNYSYSTPVLGVRNSTVPEFVYDLPHWMNSGDRSVIQRYATEYNKTAVGANSSGEFYVRSDAAISEASFIRLKTVSLAWQMPSAWTKNMSCRLYAQGQNLLVITNLKGFDPETQTRQLPPLRTITLGVNVSF